MIHNSRVVGRVRDLVQGRVCIEGDDRVQAAGSPVHGTVLQLPTHTNPNQQQMTSATKLAAQHWPIKCLTPAANAEWAKLM